MGKVYYGVSPSNPVSSGAPLIDTFISSTCFELDIANSDCYSGSGSTLSNLTATPNDTASQTDYDITWSGGVTFTGTAGVAGAYLALDGTGYLPITNLDNCPMLAKAHRTDQSGTWFAMAFRFVLNNATQRFMGNVNGSADRGHRISNLSDEQTDHWQTNGGGTQTRTANFCNATLSDATDYLLVMTWDGTTSTNNLHGAINSTSFNTTSSAFKTSTADANQANSPWKFCTNQGATAEFMANNSRVYFLAGGDGLLSGTDLSNLVSNIETKTGIDFTP